MDKAEYADLQGTKPHLAIAHITKAHKPQQLYKGTMDTIEWRKNENSLKDNSCRLMQKVATQTKKLHVEQRMIHAHSDKIKKEHM